MTDRTGDGNRRERFGRAFVAVSYVFGRRGPDLAEHLSEHGPAVEELLARIGHPSRTRRAQVLAVELGRIAAALDARRLA